MAGTYSVSMPPTMIQFGNLYPCVGELLSDLENEGSQMFDELERSLNLLKPKFDGSTFIIKGCEKVFSNIEEMLLQEFEEIQTALIKLRDEQVVHRVLKLNKLWWVTLLESCVWERRINSLYLCPNPAMLDAEDWFWSPFEELKGLNMKELDKFESLGSHSTECLPKTSKFITEELGRVRIPLSDGENSNIVAAFENELSSIVACALALLKDNPLQVEEAVHSDACFGSFIGQLWFSDGSSDGSSASVSDRLVRGSTTEECLDGLSSFKSIVTSGTLHPHVCLGVLLGEDKYTVRCPYAKQFHDLRSQCCTSEVDFIDSLNRCSKWDAKGGKSKSFFAKTRDGRLIVKAVQRTEYNSFVKFANAYFAYMQKAHMNHENYESCLARVLGIYQVVDSKKKWSHDLIVMENLSYGQNFAQQYDLKGVDIKARYIKPEDASGNVLLDKNFVVNMVEYPKFLSNEAKQKLDKALKADATFLHSIKVMDYSLLVGVDDQRQEFVCGIIDYLGPYTWIKCLETCYKSCYRVPTVMPPKQYSKRFLKFMSKHFLTMPPQVPEDNLPIES